METAARDRASPARPIPPPRPATAYCAPIDGLRAVAVGAVVLFHFGVAPFSGGFIGVDVFFVISGFLITRLILADSEAGAFSFARFCRRRVLRLFPALYVMLASSLAAALLLLYPVGLRRFGDSLASVAGLGSNVYFRNSFGYFDSTADQKPLLHTWSLSVEEQFYLGSPLVVAALARRSRRTAAAVLGPLAAASLAASLWAVEVRPLTAFYIGPYRFWELMIGGLLPLTGLTGPRSRAASEAVAWGGLALIAAAIFGETVDTAFPGAAALPPCLGAAAVILSCGGPRTNSLAALLSVRPALALGRLSYSLYLWHWPVLVFAEQWLFRRPTGPETAALLALSVGCAALSYRFVERPFRRGRPVRARAAIASALGAMAAAALCGGALVEGQGLPQRFPPEVRAILEADDAAARELPDAPGCLDGWGTTAAGGLTCHIGAAIFEHPNFVVWGDSLAGNLRSPIAGAAAEAGLSGLLIEYHSCAPLDGVEAPRVRGCRAFDAAVEARVLADPEIRTVILVSFWAAAVSRFNTVPGRPEALLRDADSGSPTVEDSRRAFAGGLERLVAALTAAGKRVVIVASVPETGADVPEALARMAQGRGRDPSPTRAGYLDRQAAVFRTFSALADRYGVDVLYPHDILCPGSTCAVAAGGHPLYVDAGHLNGYGVEALRPLFDGLF